MTFRVQGNLDIRFQGLNLNCGRYCLEALMRWKHGSAYGAPVTAAPAQVNGVWSAQYGAPRTAHDQAVQNHIDTRFKIAFNPGRFAAAYGLEQLTKPTSAAAWENHLRNYGPLIVSGHIGAVRIIPIHDAGHYILVIGVSANNDIEYYDPLRLWHSLGSEPASLSFAKFDSLSNDEVYVAAA